MADMELSYDVEHVESNMRAIRKGVREGIGAAAESLVGKGKDAAQDRIMQRRRVWHGETYESFFTSSEIVSPTVARGEVVNFSPHGAVVDEGRTPGERAPQVQDIIEWVAENVTPRWKPPDNSDSGTPTDTSIDTPAILDGDATISDIVSGREFGIDGSANQNDIRIIKYESGEWGIFKDNNVSGSTQGVVENEEVFSRMAERMGWNEGFPLSRQTSIDTDDGDATGNIQQWIDDAEPVMDSVRNYSDLSPDYTPEEFAEDNLDWAARVGVLDYILGNTDRHAGNMLLDADNQPWAIDNGGHARIVNNDLLRQRTLLAFDEWERLDRVDQISHEYTIQDPERMYAASNAILDRQEEIFSKLGDDPELRRELTTMAEALHNDESAWQNHFKQRLSPDEKGPHSIFTERLMYDGDTRWEHDIQSVRDLLDGNLSDRRIDEASDPDGSETPWWDDTISSFSGIGGFIDDELGLLEDE